MFAKQGVELAQVQERVPASGRAAEPTSPIDPDQLEDAKAHAEIAARGDEAISVWNDDPQPRPLA